MDTDAGRPPTGFDSELSIRGVSAATWSLLAPLVWTGTNDPPDTFVVPVGFVTDFATVPRFLHWLVSPYGPYTRAAVLHDWLLVELAGWAGRHGGNYVLTPIDGSDDAPPANSRDADGIFRRVMQDLGTPWAKRWVMWTAVRWAALFSSRRAYGRDFARDLPRVLGISLVAIPVVLPGAVGVLLSLGIARLFGGRKSVPPIRGGQRGRTARNGISDRS